MCGKGISWFYAMSDSTLKRTGSYVTDNVTNCVHVCAFIILSLCLSLSHSHTRALSPPMHCTTCIQCTIDDVLYADALCSMQQTFALLHMLEIMSNSKSFVKWKGTANKTTTAYTWVSLKLILCTLQFQINLNTHDCIVMWRMWIVSVSVSVSVFLCFSIKWMHACVCIFPCPFRYVWSQFFCVWIFFIFSFIKFVKNSFKSHTVQLAPLICPIQLTCRTQTGQHL